MSTRYRLLHPVIVLLLYTCTVQADTLHVPSEYPTIAAGLAAAEFGDTVLVACGHHHVADLQMKDGVTLRSAGGTADCVTLNGQSANRIMVGVGLSESTRIEGFTFRWGRATDEGETGAALHLFDSHPTIRHCDFLESVATWGGALSILDSRAVFEDCRFESNRAYHYGGAVWCDDVAPVTFTRCEFRNNDSGLGGGALSAYGASHVTLVDCVFRDNESTAGGGLHAITSSPYLDHCIFVDNFAESHGGAFALQGGDASVQHCTFARNAAHTGSALDYRSHEGGLTAIPNLNCCILAFGEGGAAVACEPGDAFAWNTDIYGHEGGDWTGCMAPLLDQWGNISEDPQFCSESDFINLGLQLDSPCAGEACSGYMGALPASCGIAATRTIDWGRLKLSY